MEDRLARIVAELDSGEVALIYRHLREILQCKDAPEAEQLLRQRLLETGETLKDMEAKAAARVEERRNNPECTFCGKRATEAQKMFRKTEYLSICSDCVRECYEELMRQ